VKHKVAELEGEALDAAVCMALGWTRLNDPNYHHLTWVCYWGEDGFESKEYQPQFSNDWEWSGPIIERERIAIAFCTNPDGWFAEVGPSGGGPAGVQVGYAEHSAEGATPLVAAMRAYVVSKFGDEVELP
jgi:hypothetical protein